MDIECTHIKPTPDDEYCNSCGLGEEFWQIYPQCPAEPMVVRVRMIGKKYKVEGQIVKVSNGQSIPDNEPVFLIRAKDKLAILGIKAYRALCMEAKCTEYQLLGLDEIVSDFQQFADENPRLMKQPGSTKGT